MEKYTIKQFDAQFPNDDVCLDFLKAARWPDGVTCAKCQKVTNHYRITGRKVYSCEFCGTQVSPRRIPSSTSPRLPSSLGSMPCSSWLPPGRAYRPSSLNGRSASPTRRPGGCSSKSVNSWSRTVSPSSARSRLTRPTSGASGQGSGAGEPLAKPSSPAWWNAAGRPWSRWSRT